jgi:hypothetical protein
MQVMALVAEIGAWPPASYCQVPRNRRGAMPHSLRVAFWDHLTRLGLLRRVVMQRLRVYTSGWLRAGQF